MDMPPSGSSTRLLGNFLSGMETGQGQRPEEVRVLLGNFLSGMETGPLERQRCRFSRPWKLP